ncbi:MAG: hypothetical protein PVF68_15020 [Acidobacteriota bacterium]|jgi:hypothetical protein
MNLAEALVALGVIAALAGIGAGPVREGLARARLDAAGTEIARRMIAARWRAVGEGRSIGLRFEVREGEWHLVTYGDGDGDGIRSDDIRSGRDAPLLPAAAPGDGRPGIRLGIPPGSYPRIPPSRGRIAGGEDPIRFGRSDIASFSPLGNATPGTVYLTDGRRLAAVVLFGATARVRLLRYDASAGEWR